MPTVDLSDKLPTLDGYKVWIDRTAPGDRVVLSPWNFVVLLGLLNPDSWPDLKGEYVIDGRSVEVK